MVSCVASMVSHGHVLHQWCHMVSCVASVVLQGVMCCEYKVSRVMFCINGCHVLAPMSVMWCHVLYQWSMRIVV